MLLVLLAVLPALGLLLYDAANQRRHRIADATQEALRAVQALAQVQARLTDSTRQLLSTLAVMPEVRRRDAGACNALLASLLGPNPIYANLLAADAQGSVFASGLPHGPINLADRKHFKDAMAEPGFVAGEYIVSRSALEPVFPFAFAFRDEAGAVAGLLVASVRLNSYDAVFDRFRLPEDSIFGIVDHTGIRLYYHPKSEANLLGAPVSQEIKQALAEGGPEGVALLPGADGCRRYYAYEKLRLEPEQPPYMTLVVGLPESAVLGPARQSLLQNLLLLAGAAGLALGVAWFVGGTAIAARLDRIADTADRIGQGDFAARTDLPYGDSGIGKVARTLDAMAGLLAAHETDREQALAALRQSQERMAHITVSMADWIWEIDGEDRYDYVSDKVRDVLGWEPAELKGKTLFDFLAPGEKARLRPIVAALKDRGEPFRDLEGWWVAKDGGRRCLLVSGVPWHDEAGKRRGYRGVGKDITQRVASEKQIRESLEEKEILLKEIHHRVKNNLQIISGLLYLQEEQVRDATALEAFRESRHRIASMALVHETLYRSTNLSRVALDSYVRDLLPRLFGEAANGRNIAFDCRLREVCVPIEQAVPTGLIINELLTNAYKHAFAHRGRGALGISVDQTLDAVEIVIRDDGPGLPQDLDLSHTTSLGMQLVVNLTRQLRGELQTRNENGAVFTLRFPRQA